MTQKQIAEKLNINLRTLSNWKNEREEVYEFIIKHIELEEKERTKNSNEYIKDEMIKAIEKLPEAKAKKFYYLMMAELVEMGH